MKQDVIMICEFGECRRNSLNSINGCTKHLDVKTCMCYKTKPEYFFKKCTTPITKVIPKYNDNTYTFRGPINLVHLTNDCIKDNKSAFLAITETKCIFGFSRQVMMPDIHDAKRLHDTYLPFHIFETDKKHVNNLMKILPEIEKQVKRQIRKTGKKLYSDKLSGKFSNKSETKVMVF